MHRHSDDQGRRLVDRSVQSRLANSEPSVVPYLLNVPGAGFGLTMA